MKHYLILVDEENYPIGMTYISITATIVLISKEVSRINLELWD
jgi:hypothetical protein